MVIRFNKGSHYQNTGGIEPGADFVAHFSPALPYMMILMAGINIPISATWSFITTSVILKAIITVPSKQVVWATGDLLNGADVLTNDAYNRLEQS